MTIAILGCGFTGKAIGRRLSDAGHQVFGTTRSAEKFDQLTACGVQPIAFDGQSMQDDLLAALGEVTHLVVSIAPPREESDGPGPVDPTLAAMAALGEQALKASMPNLQWVCYLSTVGVYGNHNGRWIDENAAPAPSSARSRQRVRAEEEWAAATAKAGLPLAIMRLSGIYGPGRNGLRSAHEGRSRRLVKKDQVFNRIHVEDIATAVHLAMTANVGGTFNITDDEPAPPQDVVTFAHHLLGTPPPPEMDFETADLSPMARSFYGENKRVSNARSKQVLGMRYDWPNYKASLQRMFDEGNW